VPDPTDKSSLAPESYWFIPLLGVILVCLYLPTLTTPFDFNDDGCMVYAAPGLNLSQRCQLVWQKTLIDFHDHGPFRPVSWAQWEASAYFFGPNPIVHRSARLLWTCLSASVLLWLLAEFGFPRAAIGLAGAAATCNPYRNEIWLGLGVAEGLAMPFALLALVCATRAARSSRPWTWDAAGMCMALLAMGCKNTFAAIVPAQFLLRVLASRLPWREALSIHGRRAGLALITLAMPVVHYLLFKLQPTQPGHYTTSPSWAQAGHMVQTVVGAAGIDCLGAGLILAVVALWLARREGGELGSSSAGPDYRSALFAGGALLVFGIGVYLPIAGTAWRYAQPAVWGADLLLAALFSVLVAIPARAPRRLAFAVLTCGLVPLVLLNLAKQDKFAARTRLLWEALSFVEEETPPASELIWMGFAGASSMNQELDWAEGMHFGWHLAERKQAQLNFHLQGCPSPDNPFGGSTGMVDRPAFALSGPARPPGADWVLVRKFDSPYWLGRRCYHCYLWRHTGESAPAPARISSTSRGPSSAPRPALLPITL
jgi:hypothetical protein